MDILLTLTEPSLAIRLSVLLGYGSLLVLGSMRNSKAVTLNDVFTIFPEAETEMLKMIIGRIGVGRSNHRPPNFLEPVDHTARMAAVIVGKDAGLGKSTIFNGMTAAFSKCGFALIHSSH